MPNEDKEVRSPQETSEVPKEISEPAGDEKLEEKETTPEPHLSERERLYSEIKKSEGETDVNSDILKSLEETGDEPKEEGEAEAGEKEETEEKSEKKPEDEGGEEDEVERLKSKMQKRIGKEVGKRKSVEERLKEAEAEVARLKEAKDSPTKEDGEKETPPPSVDQIKAYIIKMREEGNVAEEVQANVYLVERLRDDAIKKIEEKQNAVETERVTKVKRYQELVNDFSIVDKSGKLDMNHPLNLANQDSKLFKTAMALYTDKELQKEFYSDPDKINGFRRAVSDAYRELVQMGVIKDSKPELKTNREPVKKRQKAQLGSPGAETEDRKPVDSTLLTDADKVKQEMLARRKFNAQRMKVPA